MTIAMNNYLMGYFSIVEYAIFSMAILIALFAVSEKWVHDKILMVSLIVSAICLTFLHLGYLDLAITTTVVSNFVLILYSIFFRRNKKIQRIFIKTYKGLVLLLLGLFLMACTSSSASEYNTHKGQ